MPSDPVAHRFDPEIRRALTQARPSMRWFGDDTIDEIRRLHVEGMPGYPPPDLTLGGSLRSVPAQTGDGVPVLILEPVDTAGPRPVIFYTHGGGMVSGTSATGLLPFARAARDLGALVLSVDYRLAPEHPFPAALEDVWSAWTWLSEQTDRLRIDPARVVVAGESAGGNLAAALTLQARDRGGPAPSRQMLICPMLDDRPTESQRMLDRDGIWDLHDNAYAWGAYLGGREATPYAAPARAQDLSGLPPAYVDVAEVELFRDEAIDYARRLTQAGVPTELHVWAGGCHGFDTLAPDSVLGRASLAVKQAFLARALTP